MLRRWSRGTRVDVNAAKSSSAAEPLGPPPFRIKLLTYNVLANKYAIGGWVGGSEYQVHHIIRNAPWIYCSQSSAKP